MLDSKLAKERRHLRLRGLRRYLLRKPALGYLPAPCQRLFCLNWGYGFRVHGLRVYGLGSIVYGFWFRGWGRGLGLRVYGLRFRVLGLGFEVQGLGFMVYGLGSRV